MTVFVDGEIVHVVISASKFHQTCPCGRGSKPGWYYFKDGKPEALQVDLDTWAIFCSRIDEATARIKCELKPLALAVLVPWTLLFFLVHVFEKYDNAPWFISLFVIYSVIGFGILYRAVSKHDKKLHAAHRSIVDSMFQPDYSAEFEVEECACGALTYVRFTRLTSSTSSYTDSSHVESTQLASTRYSDSSHVEDLDSTTNV
jgi:hypothetical protein